MTAGPTARWRAWWFPPDASLARLAAARIVLALLVLRLDAPGRFDRVPVAAAAAWHPLPVVRLVDEHPPSPVFVRTVSVALEAALVASAAGVATNASLGIAFVLQLLAEGWLNSLGKVTHATLPMLYALLAFSLSPCGRRWSVDAWIRGRLARRRGALPPRDATSPMAAWPLEFVFVVIALFYFQAGVAKLQSAGLAWADGDTLQFYLLQQGVPAGAWLGAMPGLCRLASAAVLLFELGFPLAVVLRRLRPAAFAAALAFHAGTAFFLGIVFWPLWALFALFLPWEKAAGALARAAGRRDPLVPAREG